MSEIVQEVGDIELFVPGRICLLGEHSDWAGGFRAANSELEEGYCLVCGTDQGLFARVRKNATEIKLRSLDEEGKLSTIELPLDPRKLLAIAKQGSFFSYAAGVIYHLVLNNNVEGIEIDNYKTTLPMRKGLSSSASFCVLVARAYNILYKLNYSVRGEMKLAYEGEITTPSKCGRMDQCCAFGKVPVFMTFDGDFMECEPLSLPQGTEMFYVLVDLCAGKNTVKILDDLSRGFPVAQNETEKAVQRFLGPTNKRLLQESKDAFLLGDIPRIGELMVEYQSLFDEALTPACPQELTSPKLHECITHPSLQPLIYGAKGVGSQGDGTAQLLCRSKECQVAAAEIIKHELKMLPLLLTISAPSLE